MSAPEYVPIKPAATARSYSSPPRRPDPWLAVRPGDLGGDGQPFGERYGTPGPDQGYVYKLLHLFETKIYLTEDEAWEDARVGAAMVALKRAAMFGRAPVVHDVTVGFGVWGFFEPDPPAELLPIRRRYFATISHPAHYTERLAVADAVPPEVLRRPHTEIVEKARTDWRSLLRIEPVTH
ncbi:MAG: hypothetical protein QOJ19_1163 [Acidimicrobiia bacterium]|jgi:hypothetical protein|nr:hypothetical protein [Acidimicrobiia bacterium]